MPLSLRFYRLLPPPPPGQAHPTAQPFYIDYAAAPLLYPCFSFLRKVHALSDTVDTSHCSVVIFSSDRDATKAPSTYPSALGSVSRIIDYTYGLSICVQPHQWISDWFMRTTMVLRRFVLFYSGAFVPRLPAIPFCVLLSYRFRKADVDVTHS